MGKRRGGASGFTLVELLVVIGIIALLIGILLPVLSKARESGNTIKCAANLRSIGQGFAIYLAENRQTFPAAYVYNTGAGAPDVGGGTAGVRTHGYTHWSWWIFRARVKDGPLKSDGFICPSFGTDGNGLPPTNPSNEDREGGQVNDPGTAAGVIDNQVGRLAYTVNEAIIPRNKFNQNVEPFFPPNHYYAQHVPASRVKESSTTILATEFVQNWQIVSEADATNGATNVIKSHRPVHAYESVTVTKIDLSGVPRPTLASQQVFIRASGPPKVLPPDAATAQTNRLWWVGRNHGKQREKDPAKTNFLYVDGHVETKTIEETLLPDFQWGKKIYSLQGEPKVILQ